MKQDYFKSYKYFKVAQLVLIVIFAIVFFCYLYFDKNLRSNVLSNRSLLTICVFLWLFMVYSLICIVWDFKQLEGNIVHDSVLNKAAYMDTLTGIPNRYSCDRIIEEYGARSDISSIGCALVTISNLSDINSDRGRIAGNVVLRDFSRVFDTVGSRYGFVGRNSGNEFLFVMENCDDSRMNDFIADLNASLDKLNEIENNTKIEISTHYILNSEMNITDFTELVAALCNSARRG